MPEALRLVAFASPDGVECGIALGGSRTARPPEADARFALAEALADPHEPLLATAGDDVGFVTGAVARPAAGESLRVAIAVFPEGRILALTALRPRRARGHDRDVIDAIVLEAGVPQPVEDPRLSVTLDAAGSPRRVGLELWLAPADPEAEDLGPASYPRRASGTGEVTPDALEGSDGLRVVAQPVQWRSRGEDGFGWFVHAEPA